MLCQDAYGNLVYCAQQQHQASAIDQLFGNPIVLILWALCGVLCALIAQSKNRPVGRAVIGGLLLGFIAVVIYACLSKVPESPPEAAATA